MKDRTTTAVKVITAIALIAGCVWGLTAQIGGAIDCQNHGGQYVKNWTGFHVCVGAR